VSYRILLFLRTYSCDHFVQYKFRTVSTSIVVTIKRTNAVWITAKVKGIVV